MMLLEYPISFYFFLFGKQHGAIVFSSPMEDIFLSSMLISFYYTKHFCTAVKWMDQLVAVAVAWI